MTNPNVLAYTDPSNSATENPDQDDLLQVLQQMQSIASDAAAAAATVAAEVDGKAMRGPAAAMRDSKNAKPNGRIIHGNAGVVAVGVAEVFEQAAFSKTQENKISVGVGNLKAPDNPSAAKPSKPQLTPPPLPLTRGSRARGAQTPGAYPEGVDTGIDDGTEELRVDSATSNRNESQAVEEANPNAGLAVANPVDEDAVPNLPQASEFDPQGNPQKRQRTAFFLLGIVALAAIGLAIAFSVGGKDDSSKDQDISLAMESEPLNGSTSPQGTVWLNGRFMDLLPDFCRSTLQESLVELDFEAPHYKALSWLFADPNVQDYPDFRLLQRYAMATLYFATIGDSWSNKTYWLSYYQHECHWYTFEPLIDQVNSVEVFRPSVYYMSQRNATCLYGDQQHIDHLLLMDNNLQGRIPEELYLLSKLRVMDLDLNALEGTLSSRIALLPHLQKLSIITNQLTGTLPGKEISTLHNLTQIMLTYNSFTGTVPTELAKLTNLEQLTLDINGFTGSIPTELGLLSNKLQYINMAYNPITGTIPTEIGSLGELIFLSFHNNDYITGTLPSQIGGMTSLVAILTRYSAMTGALPTELGLLSKIEVLYFQGNRYTGNLPSQLGLLSDIIKISAHENQLGGRLPSELGQLNFLGNPEYHSYSQIMRRWGPDWAYQFEAYDNAFTGAIPTEYGMIGALTLALNGNSLSGSLPVELSYKTDLRRLHLHDNAMTGSIAPELFTTGWDESLVSLNLANNSGITGSLPFELGACALLSELIIANCSLSGTIPDELGDLAAVNGTNLTVLDLSGNGLLTGVIPAGLCNLEEDGLLFDCSEMLCGCDCKCDEQGEGIQGNESSVTVFSIIDGK